MEVKGAREAPFIGRGRGPWRAGHADRGGAGLDRARTQQSPDRSGEEGDPDRWAPPIGGRRKERGAGPDWAGNRETGRRDFPGPRGEKGKGKRRDGLAGLKRGRG